MSHPDDRSGDLPSAPLSASSLTEGDLAAQRAIHDRADIVACKLADGCRFRHNQCAEVKACLGKYADVPAAPSSSGDMVSLPRQSTVAIQEAICDHAFGEWRKEDVRTQSRCRSEAADIYDAIVTFASPSAIGEQEGRRMENESLMLELCHQLGAKDGESMVDMLFAAVRDAKRYRWLRAGDGVMKALGAAQVVGEALDRTCDKWANATGMRRILPVDSTSAKT